MNKILKSVFIIFVFSVICVNLYSNDYKGTYSKDFTIDTLFNNVNKEDTLVITNNSTCYVETDLIIRGNLTVEKGSAFKASKDGAGHVEIHKGAVVKGVDFYYKLIYADGTEGVRKIPDLENVWKGNNQEAKDYVLNCHFIWSDKYNGWIQKQDARRIGNPFKEAEIENWIQVWTKSVQVKNNSPKYKSIEVKNKAKVNFTKECNHHFYVDDSITVEKGAELTSDFSLIAIKYGCKIKGLPLYCKTQDNKLYKINDLEKLWKSKCIKDEDEYLQIKYDKDLKGWIFENSIYTNEFDKNQKSVFENAVKECK